MKQTLILLIFLVIVGVYYNAWRHKEWITVRVEERDVWSYSPGSKGAWHDHIITKQEEVLTVILHQRYPSGHEMTWWGFPKYYNGGWSLLTTYFNPPKDQQTLKAWKSEAWKWVKSEMGQKAIRAARRLK